MFEFTIPSFTIHDDMNSLPANGPRQLTKAFFNVPGKVIIIGVDRAASKVKGYYNHHINDGLLIGLGANDILEIIQDLRHNYGASNAMIIVRTEEWLDNEWSLLSQYPELEPYLLDEVNEVDGHGRSMYCETEACCPKSGWNIKAYDE